MPLGLGSHLSALKHLEAKRLAFLEFWIHRPHLNCLDFKLKSDTVGYGLIEPQHELCPTKRRQTGRCHLMNGPQVQGRRSLGQHSVGP